MNMTDELERLAKLRKDGVLTEDEFAQAKLKLLNPPADDGPANENKNTLGEAANRYVSLQMVMSAVGVILFLIFLFTVILPHMSGNNGPAFQTSPFPR